VRFFQGARRRCVNQGFDTTQVFGLPQQIGTAEKLKDFSKLGFHIQNKLSL